MHKIDDSFRQKKDADQLKRRKRRHQRRLRSLLIGVVFAVGLAGYVFYGPGRLWEPGLAPPPAPTAEPPPAYTSMILDVPGDPLRLEIGGQGRQSSAKLQRTPEPLRELGIPDTLSVLKEVIVPTSQKLMTAIPSSPEDFAFFQAQRNPAVEAVPTAEPAAEADDGDAQQDDSVLQNAVPQVGANAQSNGGWSNIDDAGLEGSDASYRKTEIADNTSTIALIANQFRVPRKVDDVHRVVNETPAGDFLKANGVDLVEADAISTKYNEATGNDRLHAGAVVALRYLSEIGEDRHRRKLVQIAFYEASSFQVAFAADDTGALVNAADPWVDTDLLKTLDGTDDTIGGQRFRLLDGIYSVGLRNSIASAIVGETIMYLSRGHDLGGFAATGDTLTLVYSNDGRATPAGQNRIFYAGIEGKNVAIHCFVFLPSNGKELACFETGDRSGTVDVATGMVMPVAGAVSSTFGPRRHPVLGKILMHEGVDWAAPIGTPVRAAYAGRVTFSGENGSFGNFIQIDQNNGRAEGYAHLNGMAPGIEVGKMVAAGDVIGFVGTTGQSTGPHLHFEVYENGKPVDPMRTVTAANDRGSQAVDGLVDRIIRIESGGAADIKNPFSTATGLGQFIESTWITMMKTYRPDLTQSLDRDALLALRTDPTLSREMIANLARENKADLEAAGQTATAGRLYLAHFLGPQGAISVLSSDDNMSLETLLGAPVVRANPFLSGKDVAFVKGWADQLMRSKASQSGTADAPKQQEASPEFLSFKAAIESVLAHPS
ncbi:peptidoglycan DD-metalloendopeptidase family protein [Rhizobium laguerreae]|uniref:peptidoglycan DD-metalloendopeptidase family protein n=1 Tax=Rhizobium laguerreae TaxID=1076926 RepID=UPI001C914599|nr:peptidoglycan DD-metalloendopeptidase family protein [Rhizobium laguerreae]MBY3347987.1 M23 family metallopeptidase [Rhizobium laguerreae]MBY3354950.1 M23 family metallopeptidase [Rhizobium laguerreae]MBY3376255.1 M23 family metallopeptidase [Rhizobium laguerreae]MBY3431254.1 M23 family metallopeptidase [Rhizobium laguerreae]MBY3439870.1 M23 family metallopeptidase [Rhizobium laguerreae]